MSIFNINSVKTRNTFIDENHIVVIYYYTTWCKSCKQITTEYDKLTKEYDGKVLFAKEDYSEILDLEDIREQIKCVPTFHIYVDKELKSIVEGNKLDRVRQNLELSLAK